MLLFEAVIFSTVLFCIPDAYGKVYTDFNATDKFAEFKERFNKVYNNLDEEKRHYLAFVNNLNAAVALNDTSPASKTIFVMNKYADLDPAEVEERYAIHLKTYDIIKEGDYQKPLRSDQGVEVNDHNLHNLRNSKEVFEKYNENGKINSTEKGEDFLHFYKFVQTLAEKNRGIYEGSSAPSGAANQDRVVHILSQDDEFFY